jgi:SAM-dependent methyltransferase
MSRNISPWLIYPFLLVGVVIAAAAIGLKIQQQHDLHDAQAIAQQPLPHDDTVEVPYVKTPHSVVDGMLKLCELTKDDVLYDLGCGDGRIVIAAAKEFGCRGVGYDLNHDAIELSRINAKKAGVLHLVEFHEQDIYTVNISEATVITLYLRPFLNLRLLPQLGTLGAGSRIVSHDFDMPGVPEDIHLSTSSEEDERQHEIYFWRTPLTVDPDFCPEPRSPEEDALVMVLAKIDWPGLEKWRAEYVERTGNAVPSKNDDSDSVRKPDP